MYKISLYIILLFTIHSNIQSEYFQKDYIAYHQEKPWHSLLPLCFMAHTLHKAAMLYCGYTVIISYTVLQEQLRSIEAPYLWQKPYAWWQTTSAYSGCFYTIAVALCKIAVARYAADILIRLTCPEQLRRITLQEEDTLDQT